MARSDTLRGWSPAIGTAIPNIILPIAVLSIPLAAARQMHLSEAETTSWIFAVYGLPGLMGLVLAIRYRQPIILTGNIFVLIFIASLGRELSYPELVGASIVAGVGVLLISVLGLMDRLAGWIPAPVVLGLLAGAVMPFVSGTFTALGDEPALVGGALLAFLWGYRYLNNRLPAILPALVAGLGIAALTGRFGQVPAGSPLPVFTFTTPAFTLHAIATATPVIVILITLQSNLPSVVFLRDQLYHPPEHLIDSLSGVGTLLGSLLGPTAVSLSLPATAIAAGPDSGEPHLRYRSAYLASGALIIIGLLAGVAANLPEIIPLRLLLALAGLAVIGVLANALQQITRGPLLLGPLFAFAIALSKISILGFGPFFWALVIGTGVSMLLEREGLRTLRSTANE